MCIYNFEENISDDDDLGALFTGVRKHILVEAGVHTFRYPYMYMFCILSE